MSADRIRVASETFPALSGPEWEERKSGTSNNYTASTTYTYKGTKEECNSKRAEVKAAGCSMLSIKPAGDGDWTLTATFPGTPEDEGGPQSDPPIDQHELEVNVEQVPWCNSPVLATKFSTYNKEVVGAVKWVVDKYKNGEFAPPASDTTNTAKVLAGQALYDELQKISSGSYTVSGLKLFKAVVGRGIEYALTYNEVYRRTITAAVYSQVQAAYTGAGKIWTSAEVEAFEGIPTTEWFGLEAGTQWLKSPPHVSAVSGGKTQITYYYTGCKQASAFFYEAYGSATLLDT